MVVDASVIAAIAFGEPEAQAFELVIADDPIRLISVATLFEATIVIETRNGELGARELDMWVNRTGLEVMPVDADQYAIVRDAWRRFGKGRHRAALNFGDCFSYALSAVTQEPLLFKGDDFARTDVLRVALP
ncbi:hypothetical protein VE25_14420 [Devosia geojensis]|uniref:Ribonuclease VapC n=1 Tax=Devosia geojensis TaxID=443610 RepID=A0A0F5FQL1_9HYPH|nr:type II toxin-antitoxin system VapC family toxin [Devosia geojensis]KKB11136.1 hypothetical protein VE25_14420 [Devosia geojensis]